MLDVADGLVLAGSTPSNGATAVNGCHFGQQDQFGMLVEGVSVDMQGNTFDNNMYGYGAYGAGTVRSDTPAAGVNMSPTAAMVANPIGMIPMGVAEPAP
jgi:hypothetical protein